MLLKTLTSRSTLYFNGGTASQLLANMLSIHADSTNQYAHAHQYATAANTGVQSKEIATMKRIVHDTMGSMEVSSDKLWGAQTQRSLENFNIGDVEAERMPEPLIRALGAVKKAAAQANTEAGLLAPNVGKAVMLAASEVAEGRLSEHFPLRIWQTGSGTHTNMNANEVIAARAMQLLEMNGGSGGHHNGSQANSPAVKDAAAQANAFVIHPNDHVNMGQSSNDTIPTAMHVATSCQVELHLLPALKRLLDALLQKSDDFADIVKVGRTHTQDATPLTLGQEFSAWAAQVEHCRQRLKTALPGVHQVAQGGTAVGTGLNSWKGFDQRLCDILSQDLGITFQPAANKFEALASHDAMVHLHGALNTLATALFKIGNDIRFLASGPRCGLGDLLLPVNEPGSSIMPGKVNPSQSEMLTMVCCQVFGHHTTVTVAGSQGHFQLNAFKPLIAAAVLRSIRLLGDACNSFTTKCVEGIQPNKNRIQHHLEQSLMMVTALSPHIGYEKAAAIAKDAYARDVSLMQAALAAGVDEQFFVTHMSARDMLAPYDLNKARQK